MKKRRRQKDHSAELSRLAGIFGELGLRGVAVPPEQVERRTYQPPPKGVCGKSTWNSETSVRSAIKKLRNGKGDTAYLRPFHCDKCHGWHMTSVKSFKKP